MNGNQSVFVRKVRINGNCPTITWPVWEDSLKGYKCCPVHCRRYGYNGGPGESEGVREGIRCIAEDSHWREPEPGARKEVQGEMILSGNAVQNDREGLYHGIGASQVRSVTLKPDVIGRFSDIENILTYLI